MNNDVILKQLQSITGEYELVSAGCFLVDKSDLEVTIVTNIISRAKAVIARNAGTNSEYYKDIVNSLAERGTIYLKLRKVMGTVYAFKKDVENDFLKPLYSLVQSEVFSDYLDMSEHLSSQGYKDASAVIAGSTLEAHLKEQAKAHSIDIQSTNAKGDVVVKKVSTLNDELAKAGVYSSIYQKQITAWLGIRNDAAHGNYSKYTKEQVDLLIQGIRQFTLK